MKNNLKMFSVEFDESEYPEAYWGEELPSLKEAVQFMCENGHQHVVESYGVATDVIEIPDIDQAAVLWRVEDINKNPVFVRTE